MQSFSEDSFFILGINALLKNLDVVEADRLLIFDTGHDYIYVLDDDEVKHLINCHPVSAFLRCRRSLMDRAAGTHIYSMLLSEWRFGCAKPRNPAELTTSEALIIRMISSGISQKDIAVKLHISEKTVSSHKLNAFYKLKIKNDAIYFNEYAAWYRLWIRYMNTRQ